MGRKVSIVGIQNSPTKYDLEKNLKDAFGLLDEALGLYKYVDIAVFPEYFSFVPESKDTPIIEEYNEEIKKMLAMRARAYDTYIIGGTVANKQEDGNIYNTSLVFDRNGDIIGSYDKIHLFDVLDAKGEEQESYQITRGDNLLTFDTDFGRVGVLVCYDVRFPEMARTYALKGVEYLMVPAAFFSPRFDHWQDLIKAAALQNGMYVMGVNIFGKVCDTLNMCGRSLIADPWGIPVATAPDKPSFIQAYVDSDYPSQIRDALGTFHNRVPSVYDIK